MAAGGKKEAIRRCTLFDCICCWRRDCSPRIPRFAPGRDYVCIPAGADDHPAWSLLVGFRHSSSVDSTSSDSVLGLHEFRVARSGRVLGGSGDALDVRHTKDGVYVVSASATLAPDGRSICLFFSECLEGKSNFLATPRAQRLHLTCKPRAITVSGMPRLPLEPSSIPCRARPVSAAGRLWAPYFHHEREDSSFSLKMHRLDDAGRRWEQVSDIFPFPHKEEVPSRWRWAGGGSVFQGYAVLHDDTILLSLDGTFLTFHCSDCTWSEVTTADPEPTTTGSNTLHVPILGRGVHIEEDASVYFLCGNRIYAYRLCYDDDHHRRKLRLDPPTLIDSVCPFFQGSGFLTHLGGRLMCSVWINTEDDEFRYCCDHLHVLITTFELRSQHKGIDVLHSTCRRLDVSLPDSCAFHEFCFLQEYKDDNPSTLPALQLDDPVTCSSHVIEESSNMLPDCCRKFLFETPTWRYEFKEEPGVEINAELHLVCEAGYDSIVYVAKIENGRCHDKVLTQKYSLITSDKHHPHRSLPWEWRPWHLVFGSSSSNSSIHAVSRGQDDDVHVHRLTEGAPQYVPPPAASDDPFSIVLRVGRHGIIAVTDTLHVFHRDHSKHRPRWVACRRQADASLVLYNEGEKSCRNSNCKRGGHGRLVLTEKSELSGYAVIGEDSFLVSDANSGSILVYDLVDECWSVANSSSSPGSGYHRLNGRCVLVDGFIYSCTNGGIAAHELVWLDDHHPKHKQKQGVLLRDPILLEFSWKLPWRNSWVAVRMCLDCVCADREKSPDTIIFCVVQGECCSFRRGNHDIHITTVEVKTRTPSGRGGKREPERIEHVAIGTCFVEHDDLLVWTKTCFALKDLDFSYMLHQPQPALCASERKRREGGSKHAT